MDYTNFFTENKNINVGIIGATKGYGLSILSQIKNVDKINLRAISSRSIEDCRRVLINLGYNSDEIEEVSDFGELNNTSSDKIIITTDYNVLLKSGITSLIECTGNVDLGLKASEYALKNDINVYMVSKETDSVCGVYLNYLANKNNKVYSLVNGDQPRNAIDLYSWAKINGFKIIAVGKASEYDFVWDRETEKITYTDGISEDKYIPAMNGYREYKSKETLKYRKELLKDYINVVSADLCEMNLVSNIIGFKPSSKFLTYPVIRTTELADVFIPKEDGGILENNEVVDVFFQLREKDEASFAGGEFVIVKCENNEVWDMMKNKGHLVSRNGKYACIFMPFHLMGLESPITILLGDLKNIGTHSECRQVSVMAAYANEDMKEGRVLKVSGHHHSINGVIPSLLPVEEAQEYVPFYLLNEVKLIKDIKKGQYIRFKDVDLSNKASYGAYDKGLKIR